MSSTTHYGDLVDHLFISRQAAVNRLPDQAAKANFVFLLRESVKCSAMSLLNPKRSSYSRTRISPTAKVTRDRLKSTFNELFNES